MEELSRRGYEPADAPALAALLNQIEEHAGGHAAFTPEYVRTVMSAMIADVTTDSVLCFAPDGTMVAAGIVPAPPAGGHRVDLHGGVHPQWRGRGIGRDVLAWQFERAEQIHAAVAPEVQWRIQGSTLTGDEEALRLFRRFEMSPVRYWFEMVAPTAGAPELAVPDGLRVVTYAPEHEDAVYEVHVAAFSDHWGYQRRDQETWTALTVRSEEFLPDLSMLAFDGDTLTGYVLSYVDADPAKVYVGHVGVSAAWRRRGIAGGLLSRVLAAAVPAGYSTATLGVDADSPTGAVGVYERVGFTVDTRSVTYSRSIG